ncbi:MAG: glycerophosphodiester phosphodiesterase family protein [Caulobacterales bacterium]
MRALIFALLVAACGASAPVEETQEAAPPPALAPSNIVAFFDCLQRDGGTIVAAHRGAPEPGYAENAIATFDHTFAQAPVAMEIDVTQTRDGALVLLHDETLDRTTTGSGDVGAITLAQFQRLNLKDERGRTLEQHPATLREALTWAAGKTILELDIKQGVPFEAVIEEVRAANAENRVVLITYSEGAAMRLHRIAPNLMISAPIDSEADLDDLIARRADLTRFLAWTGIEEPNSALNVTLAQHGVETLFGTLGHPDRSWDARIERGEASGYAAFAEAGVELIASDNPVAAQRAIDASDGEGYRPLKCAGAN